jgi:uncharacterized protein (DUF488 family)
MTIYTLGVYGYSENQFFDKLLKNRIDLLCDIRQRRGIRGREYIFANSKYLQHKLDSLHIKYDHILELAPTKQIRQKQWDADSLIGEHKRDRHALGKEFIQAYRENIIQPFDFDSLILKFTANGCNRIAFLCVEEKAEACHRYIVAEELHKRYNLDVIHL